MGAGDEARVEGERGLPLHERLAQRTSPALLVARAADGKLRCTACAHGCVLSEGRSGACGVRFVRGGELRAPFGYVARAYVRPVETNTVYHVRPGSLALTFGMFGCDLRCPYCHNWQVSQALRDGQDAERPRDVRADDLVDTAVAHGCRVVCAAYNEPMIAAEWVHAVFAASKARGLTTVIVSDGNTTPEALAFVRPVTDVFRVDLKAPDSTRYSLLGGRLEPVLAGIGEARRLGFWVEVVTLVVPGFNDDPSGIKKLGDALMGIDPAIPWHLNAFQPRYRMRDRPTTSPGALVSLAGSAYARGMRFVYVGNVHASMPELEHTRCPRCHSVLVERADYRAQAVRLENGACSACGERIPEVWDA